MDIDKIFNNGRSQAVRLPKEFRFDESEVCVAKLDDMVILFPAGKGWELMEKGIQHFTDDFMSSRNQPTKPQRRGKL
jgi:antitoxin VapB